MKIAVRTLTILGIVYLLVCGVCLGVLAARNRHFHKTAPTTVGTITDISAPTRTAMGRLGPDRSLRYATISYSINGKPGTFTEEFTLRNNAEVGSTVVLVYLPATDGGEPQVMVRYAGIKPVGALSLFLLFSAGLVACIAVFRLVQRRPIDASRRPTQPHDDLAELEPLESANR